MCFAVLFSILLTDLSKCGRSTSHNGAGEMACGRWFNLAAFVDRVYFDLGVGSYTFGNSGRNGIVGPGIVKLAIRAENAILRLC